jgi:hypothetical protein
MNVDQDSPVLLTVGTCNRRAGIAVVAESFLRHHSDGQVFICLVDRPPSDMPALNLPGTTFFADQIALPGEQRFLFKYTAFELCCALKPFAIRYLSQFFGIRRVVYLDSDILVFKPFWERLCAAWETHSVLITPHLVSLPTGISFDFQRSLAQHGAYNGGFIAVAQTDQANAFLDCWASLLESGCTFDPMNNIYVDQRWLDLLVSSSADVAILRESGLNVAYWNLHQRRLKQNDQLDWEVNSESLKFFHFSGFDRQGLTTKMPCTDKIALELADYYGDLLQRAGEQEFRAFPYGWDRYSDGTPISPIHRDLILANPPELAQIANPFMLPQLGLPWQVMQRLADMSAPLRISQRYSDTARVIELVERLYRHPVIGPIWRFWSRFINSSLKPYFPPHGRA